MVSDLIFAIFRLDLVPQSRNIEAERNSKLNTTWCYWATNIVFNCTPLCHPVTRVSGQRHRRLNVILNDRTASPSHHYSLCRYDVSFFALLYLFSIFPFITLPPSKALVLYPSRKHCSLPMWFVVNLGAIVGGERVARRGGRLELSDAYFRWVVTP